MGVRTSIYEFFWRGRPPCSRLQFVCIYQTVCFIASYNPSNPYAPPHVTLVLRERVVRLPVQFKKTKECVLTVQKAPSSANRQGKYLSGKWAKIRNQNSQKGKRQKANKNMKKCSNSLVDRKRQVKLTARYLFTCTRLAKSGYCRVLAECGSVGALTHC